MKTKENLEVTLVHVYEGVSKSFRTGHLGRELQMIQLSATRCSCIAILWVSLESFAAITHCVAFQRVFIVISTYFVIDSVRKLWIQPRTLSLLDACWYWPQRPSPGWRRGEVTSFFSLPPSWSTWSLLHHQTSIPQLHKQHTNYLS
jgi:hypothetical protein